MNPCTKKPFRTPKYKQRNSKNNKRYSFDLFFFISYSSIQLTKAGNSCGNYDSILSWKLSVVFVSVCMMPFNSHVFFLDIATAVNSRIAQIYDYPDEMQLSRSDLALILENGTALKFGDNIWLSDSSDTYMKELLCYDLVPGRLRELTIEHKLSLEHQRLSDMPLETRETDPFEGFEEIQNSTLLIDEKSTSDHEVDTTSSHASQSIPKLLVELHNNSLYHNNDDDLESGSLFQAMSYKRQK